MHSVAALLRIIAGVAVIGVAAYVYISNRAQLSGSDTAIVQIFGVQTTGTPGQILLAFAAVGLIGLVLVLLGIAGLLRK